MIAIDMEMPKSCDSCRFHFGFGTSICVACGEKYIFEEINPKTGRPRFCPIKEAKLHRKCKRVDLYEVEK